jgi:hypothetical protein
VFIGQVFHFAEPPASALALHNCKRYLQECNETGVALFGTKAHIPPIAYPRPGGSMNIMAIGFDRSGPADEPNGRGMGWRAGPAWLGTDAYSDECAANARLIAAAPELLEALRNVIGWVSGPEKWHTDAPALAVDRARAAIAKATGATP